MRAAAGPLAPAEIAVRSRCAALAGFELVAVDRGAERTSGIAPLESRVAQDAIEAFALGLRLNEARAGNDPRRHFGFSEPGDFGRGADVLDAGVGARPDEDAIDRDVL